MLVLAVIGFGIVVLLDSKDSDDAGPAPSTSTAVVSVTRSSTASSTVVAPVTPPPTETVITEAPVGSVVVEGGVCDQSEVRSFGTDASGQSLVCASMGAAAPPRWVRHGDNDGSVHNVGDPCDPDVDATAQDPNGLAIMCSVDHWVANP
ncbi:MAG: hypothetical protein QM658_10720 [Gordonia sp. (in: high G+C Gram-positive bacteria)]